MFPWRLSDEIAAGSVVDLSSLNGGPLGPSDAVRLTADRQHLQTADGRPVRLFGVSTSDSANFPSAAEAAATAARLARLGFNCVRLCHMDTRIGSESLLDAHAGDHRHINASHLDALDRFVFELSRRGIYVDLNLHVVRQLDERDGVPGGDQGPPFNKGVDIFDPRMIDLQREYARQLLGHVNRHTGRRFADDPALALVEITNEDGLLVRWGSGDIDRSPESLRAPLRDQWNAWLRARYHSEASLRDAWNAESHPPGPELVLNGDFAEGLPPWALRRTGQAVATASWLPEAPPATPTGSGAVCIRITRPGTQRWHVDLNSGPVPVRRGEIYELRAAVRSPGTRSMRVVVMNSRSPWANLGLNAIVNLGASPEWRNLSWRFRASGSDPLGRISFIGLGPETGEICIARVSLRAVGAEPLSVWQTLAQGNVDVLSVRSAGECSETCLRDWLEFLWDTEEAYGRSMVRYLHDDLGVKCPVTVTQVNSSPPTLQAAVSDLVANNVYWDHPVFTGIPSAVNWRINNQPLTSAAGLRALCGMDSTRVRGRPYVITEFNQLAPNTFGAEGFPLAALMGSFQDWDGLFLFDWSHSPDDAGDHIENFFDIIGDPAKLVTANVAARIFRQRPVASARRSVHVPLARSTVTDWTLHHRWEPYSLAAGVDPLTALVHGLALDPAGNARWQPPAAPEGPIYRSDTGEITWDLSDADRALVTLSAPSARLVDGFAAGKTISLGDIQITPGQTSSGWSFISLTSSGSSLGAPGRWLLAAVGRDENTGLEWNTSHTSVDNHWGTAPTLVEGVPASLSLPFAAPLVRVWALDGSGARDHQVPVDGARRASITIGPQDRTFWYEIEIGSR
jgi:hypothetical protein